MVVELADEYEVSALVSHGRLEINVGDNNGPAETIESRESN
jgi:hypothetical protein